jgi:predicted XRE-type DNA-binding protein
MTVNLNRLAAIAKTRSEESFEQSRFRKENRDWLQISQEVALALRRFLRTENMSQEALAAMVGVFMDDLTSLLNGGEIQTMETICKIQNVVGRDLMSAGKPFLDR